MIRLISVMILGSLPALLTAQSHRTSWPMIGGDAAHTSFAPTTMDFPLVVKDRFMVQFNQENGVSILDERLFLSDYGDSNRVVAVDLVSGETLWSFGLPDSGGGVNFVPVAADSLVLVGGQGAKGLYALDAQSGDVRWFLPVKSLYTRVPTIRGDRVYLTSFDSLTCADLYTGEVHWSRREAFPQVCPVADEQHVYACSYEALYALDRFTGQQVWVNDTVHVDHFMHFAVDSLRLFTALQREIHALDRSTGEIRWTHTLDTGAIVNYYPGTMAMNADFLLVKVFVDPPSAVEYILLEKATGHVVNRFPGGAFTWSAPTWIGRHVVEFSQDQLRFFDVFTGDLIYTLDGFQVFGVMDQIPVANGKIYLAGLGPNLLVLESQPAATAPERTLRSLAVMPNPATESTEIRFELMRSSACSLRIVGADGAVLRHRLLGVLPAGAHTRREEIGALSPGQYYITLQADGAQQVLPLQVIR